PEYERCGHCDALVTADGPLQEMAAPSSHACLTQPQLARAGRYQVGERSGGAAVPICGRSRPCTPNTIRQPTRQHGSFATTNGRTETCAPRNCRSRITVGTSELPAYRSECDRN